MMWRLMVWTLWLFVPLLLRVRTVCVSAVELQGQAQVKTEVVFKPEECTQRTKKGDMVNAHYDGYLHKDGSQFYCSRSDKEGHPQWFVLGVGQVIKGLDIGLLDMCAGEKRKLIIPPELAFGPEGKGPVPPNATVVFEVEVYTVTRGPRSLEAFGEMDLDEDKSLTKDEIKEYLKHQYEKGGNAHSDQHYENVMSDIFHKNDLDKDGKISVKEYNIYQHDEL